MTTFKPRYTITNTLLTNMRRIGEVIGELNNHIFSGTVLLTMKREARALSAFSSTQIEGNPLPLTEVKRILKSTPERIRDTEREVINYNKALLLLEKKLEDPDSFKLSNKIVCEIQSQVVSGLVAKQYEGKYRNEPVFVNDPIKRQTIYLPPDAKEVEKLMSELVDYINEEDGKTDPIILAGIFHKEFVIVHPFLDGNGRTTRLVTKALLAKMGINTFPLFSFENYYNNNVTKYFQKVGVFGDYYDLKGNIDFTEWLEFFTDGIIDELNRVKTQLPAHQERLEAHHKKIIDYIKKNGSISAKEYAQITDRAKATRIQDFKKLSEMGMIKPKGVGKATYYVLNNS